jgi:N-acetylated-alpha-linked acidic dipeptidase
VPDFSTLRTAIRRLQDASLKLDHEKAKAEKKFRKASRRLLRKAEKCKRLRRSKFRSFVKHIFGVRDTLTGTAAARRGEDVYAEKRTLLENVHLGKAAVIERSDAGGETHGTTLQDVVDTGAKQPWCSVVKTVGDAWALEDTDPGRLPHKFLKARKAVVKANTKLKNFEKGFISREGIKDREWFR